MKDNFFYEICKRVMYYGVYATRVIVLNKYSIKRRFKYRLIVSILV